MHKVNVWELRAGYETLPPEVKDEEEVLLYHLEKIKAFVERTGMIDILAPTPRQLRLDSATADGRTRLRHAIERYDARQVKRQKKGERSDKLKKKARAK